MPINRFIVIVLDSVGIGEAPDAAAFGEHGAQLTEMAFESRHLFRDVQLVGEQRELDTRFYLGVVLIMAAVFAHTWVKLRSTPS